MPVLVVQVKYLRCLVVSVRKEGRLGSMSRIAMLAPRTVWFVHTVPAVPSSTQSPICSWKPAGSCQPRETRVSWPGAAAPSAPTGLHCSARRTSRGS